MSGAGWKDIGDLIVALVAKEPPFVQVVIGLGAAFSALMFIEGLRASFIPRRAESKPGRNPTRRSRFAAPPKADHSQTYRSVPGRNKNSNPTRDTLPGNAKRRESAVKPYRAPRPKIRPSGEG